MKILTLALTLFSLTAQAHVTMTPKSADAGSYAKLVFQVPHGCDGSATTKITIQIPDGVLSVKPQVHPGWEISTKMKKLSQPVTLHGKEIKETISEVSFAGGPLPDEYMDEFGMSVKLPEKANPKLFFPVIQDCKKGSTSWSDTSGDHEKSPAPMMVLNGPKAAESEHHHH